MLKRITAAGLVLVGCGSTVVTGQSADAGDASAPADAAIAATDGAMSNATDGATSDVTADAATDAGTATSLTGSFHLVPMVSGEENLSIAADGTWFTEEWVCDPGGGGGGCTRGTWAADGAGIKLLPPSGSAQFKWYTAQVASVSITLQNGRLHAVPSGAGPTLDFVDGYTCCDDTGNRACTTLTHACP